eukprot:Em0002g94a
MLDSGSSVSLLRQEVAQKATAVVRTQPRQEIRLVTAAGESLPIATVRLGTLEKLHDFVVVNKDLITAVILGTDFLQLHGLVLDFTTTPVTAAPSKLSANQESAPPIKPIWTAERLFKTKKCPVARRRPVILCVDYRELNKKTTKDAYPLPLIDEVQDQLSGSAVFSKLDLRSGYWQLLVDPNNRGSCQVRPGMGSFEFSRMPFGLCGAPSSSQRLVDKVMRGLCGAPSSFQWLMDKLLPAKVMRGLPFVSTYIDDVLIHSTDDEMHAKHLNEVFLRLRKAGLTLRDKKSVIGTPQVTGSSFYRIRCNSRQGESQSCGRVANSRKCNRSSGCSQQERFDGTAPEPVPRVPSGHIIGALNLPFVKMLDPNTRLMVTKQQIQEEGPGTSSVQKALVPVLFRRPWYQFCSEGPGTSSVQKALVPVLFRRPWYQFCSEGPGTSSVQKALVPVLFRSSSVQGPCYVLHKTISKL